MLKMHLFWIVLIATVGIFLTGEACNITFGILFVRQYLATTGGHDVYPCNVTILEKEHGSKCVPLHCSDCYKYKYLYDIPELNFSVNKTTECETTSDAGKHRCYVVNDTAYIYDNADGSIAIILVISLVVIPLATMAFGVVLYLSLKKCFRLRCCAKCSVIDY